MKHIYIKKPNRGRRIWKPLYTKYWKACYTTYDWRPLDVLCCHKVSSLRSDLPGGLNSSNTDFILRLSPLTVCFIKSLWEYGIEWGNMEYQIQQTLSNIPAFLLDSLVLSLRFHRHLNSPALSSDCPKEGHRHNWVSSPGTWGNGRRKKEKVLERQKKVSLCEKIHGKANKCANENTKEFNSPL